MDGRTDRARDGAADRAAGGAVRANETTVPVLPCVSATETLEFYRALGFRVTYEQTRPYLYLAVEWSGFSLHFGAPPQGFDPAREDGAACLVLVDEVASYHAEFTRALRAAYGRVPSKGRPRITRYRPGASRFTLVDPSGNSLIFIRRDEPAELEYGGSQELTGLAKALDNARVFSEFKHEDRTALKILTTALRRHEDTAPRADVARTLATLVELATALEDPTAAETWRARLAALDLTDATEPRPGPEAPSEAGSATRPDAGPEAGPPSGP
ncbi:glyoxalase [Streptomyces sp. NPDC097619]|uniref:glyoxalase n=1 Tax=Streptomyces sp. NPDC097619 TaxID=3157228 RepID=UPI00332DBC08